MTDGEKDLYRSVWAMAYGAMVLDATSADAAEYATITAGGAIRRATEITKSQMPSLRESGGRHDKLREALE